MYNYTLKNLSQLSGLEEQMIILWNKKFKLFGEEKIDKNSLFNADNLKKLIIISFLINSNKKFTVEKLSLKNLDELQVISEFEIQNYLQRNKDYQPLIRMMIVSCFSYDSKSFDTILTVCFKKLGIEAGCIDIVFPFIETMSEILEMHSVQESIKSFSKNLIRKHLFYLTKSLPYSEVKNRRWLLFLPENETHDIELLYTYLILKLNSEQGVYLGDNQSVETIKECLDNIPITHVLTFINRNYDANSLFKYMSTIKEVYPHSTIFVATYDKFSKDFQEDIPYINVNTPEMFLSYLDKIMTM